MRVPWKDRLRKGTKVRVKAFDAVVLHSGGRYGSYASHYMVTIRDPYTGEPFWAPIPAELIEVVDE